MAVPFDLGLLLQEPVADYLDLLATAEQLGFRGVWIADSQCILRDAYVALAACALRTNEMLLATGVTNPLTRHPATVACAIATLDELSGGRAILGIGTGFSAVRTLGMKPASLKQLEVSTVVLRALLERRSATYEGAEIKMTWPARKVPIYFASSGPKSLQLAGRIADGVLFQAGADPALIRYAIDNVHLGAKQAGRDPGEVTLCARLGCAVSEDRDAARNEVKPYAAAAAETVFQSKPQTVMSPELLSDLGKLKEGYDYYEHASPGAKHGGLVTDRILDSMVIAGTPAEVIPRFKAILALGVDRIVITLSVKDRNKLVRTLAEKVIPHLS